ncbi:MAG: endolytic transglycosylase MltG [Lachnospiraceae bacterium]|nr:endolytic transglycosylase MltG [Lachnospiraceae bacterium]
MKRKYYMRGLGVGILATSMIFLIALTFLGYPMSDDDIRRRASALGMVDASGDAGTSKTLAQVQKENKDAQSPDKDKKSPTSDEQKKNSGSKKDPEKKETKETTKKEKKKDSKDDEKKGTETTEKKGNTTITTRTGDKVNTGDTSPNYEKEDNGTVTFKIHSGEDSATVGANLYKAGLVDSGFEFNTYLEQNGFDTSIHPGTYTITSGSTYQQIARIITRSR